ncbi:Formylglycine-generating enzyme, required for sulfatase activity, contains SUMF1/FGE domain [Nitrosomonas aestuarii]|uniref:Formylglycine-generating enzyme, required for sulfatase activity, contains SUMF1/FGE domain n=1 Tax=Nitrosomonas aestuarii TaxID=52441 RepID=A0A1I4EBA6_9PROT|nr:formylglycine-generating enzyme family protein [Nitrosomonas aestuarii]SFL01666.1 Formylglycine-generating enzyme, required for sulfatase activity, contains SUMF1/FGE domain [Nitrosomonas aestuarii]
MAEIAQFNRYADLVLPKGTCGRADLLLALAMAESDRAREEALAAVLGFELLPDTDIIINGKPAALSMSTTTGTVPKSPQPKLLFRPYFPVRVDNVADKETWTAKQPDSAGYGVLSDDDQADWDCSYSKPEILPIVPWTRLWPRLRRAVARKHAADLDILSLAEQFSKGKFVRRLPRKQRLSWPSPLPVILDFSDRLMPYWDDWRWLNQRLQARFNQQIRFFCLNSLLQKNLRPFIDGEPEQKFVEWPVLGSGDTLLIVSDLGLNDPEHHWPVRRWREILANYRRRGVHVIVLAPVSVRHLQPDIVNCAKVVRLSPDSDLRPIRRMPPICVTQIESRSVLSTMGKTLLAMMSVATRVEPGLLRAFRQCLPDHSRDAGLEGAVWCHLEVDTEPAACALTQSSVQRWRNEFVQLPETIQQRTLDCLRDWHARAPQGVHHEEILLWRHLVNPRIALAEENNATRARQFFLKLKNTLSGNDSKGFEPGERLLQAQIAESHVHWVAPTLGKKESYIEQLSTAARQVERRYAEAELPAGIDLVAWLKSLPSQVPQRVNLLQRPDLSFDILDVTKTVQSGLTRLATLDLDRETMLWGWVHEGETPVYQPWNFLDEGIRRSPVLPRLLQTDSGQQPSAALCLHTGRQCLCFEPFNPPDWADAWGQDTFGLYADLKIDQVIQRFRWIAPGTFLMGSPETEPERSKTEVQHEVTITHGYWLADTACTQAFWSAVKKENLAHFTEDMNNPVESVSWRDVRQFIDQLNHDYPDLYARLPTEAQWEYACRAGTTTPFSFGEQITPEQVNYDGNHPYADGKKGQYRRKTVPVKSLPPNPWGLYEMHGNVWEWCADWYGAYPDHAVTDPAEHENGDGRVLRGGSWHGIARNVRSAVRNGNVPDYRSDHIGFRLALGRAGNSK